MPPELLRHDNIPRLAIAQGSVARRFLPFDESSLLTTPTSQVCENKALTFKSVFVPMTLGNSPDMTPVEATGSAEEPSFAAILSEFEQQQKAEAPAATETASTAIKGTVVSIKDDNIILDIGRKTEGALPLNLYQEAGGDVAKLGDIIEVNAEGINDLGYFALTPLKIIRAKDWSGLQAAFDEKRNIVGKVTGIVKGGLTVDIGSRAFLPASRSGVRDQAEFVKMLGQEITCRITKLDTEKEDVVVDRRAILEEEAAEAKKAAFERMKEGETVDGTVRSMTEFGAFVDLGGVDGLLHITDMSWQRIGKPVDVVNIGEQIKVKILKINPNTRKISLGLKQLIPDPWTTTLARLVVGARITGKVVRLADFGAFVELEPGVDGLIHISEMSWTKKVRAASDLLKVGEQVEVVVLGVKEEDKRISLGLKQALGDPWADVPAKYPEGTIVDATITSLQKFGAFADLGDGIEGMIHIGDIANEKRLDHPKDALHVGQVVKAKVLKLDNTERRIRLGLKQLEPTRADEYIAEHKAGDKVTGRVVDASPTRAKIELGDGVMGDCKLTPAVPVEEKKAEAGPVDINSLSAMLKSRWKEGKGTPEVKGDPNALRSGQIRNFKITAIDLEKKKIELELA